MKIIEEYKPLFFDDYFICDCMGGRGGARSHQVTAYALHELLYTDCRMFFLRQIHSTIYSSLWQDFKDRISEFEELHHSLQGIIEYTDNKNGENYAKNLKTGASITTKGFEVSNKERSANLKSLANATHLVIEEFEEVGKPEFLKLKLSLRKKGVKLRIVRAFNPPYKEHHVWEGYNLTKINESELIELTKTHTSLTLEQCSSLVSKNNKTYFKALSTKADNHICINISYIYNYQHLNETAINEYEILALSDFHEFAITILGLISASAGEQVYYEYEENKHNTQREVVTTDRIFVGMDFNIGNMNAVIHVIDSGVKSAVDEFTNLFDTAQTCAKIKEHYPNHRVIVNPDASGKNRSTTSGRSDHDIIKSFGYQIQCTAANPKVRDRVNNFNTELRINKYKVNKDKCPVLNEALKKQVYKNGEPDKTSGYDHITEAAGYFVVNNKNQTGIASIGF